MHSPEKLRERLRSIDGRGYTAYKSLAGSYDFGQFELHIDHVQGDPFASPSRIRLRVPQAVAAYPQHLLADRTRRVAVADYVARRIARFVRANVRRDRGTGKSGLIYIDAGGQEILERSAAVAQPEYIEARLSIGLPAHGRRIVAREAEEMLFHDLPRIVRLAMLFDGATSDRLAAHVNAAVEQETLRAQLAERGLVAFVGDGAILPRASGTSAAPLPAESAVAFRSPPELRVELDGLRGEKVSGMGIPNGVTLIVGGGYHGKSTLLRAIEYGVYNHIPGDGRERVVARRDTVKIRAEDGRRVEGVDISAFIRELPTGADTRFFSTDQSSGSTSQAANIVEALEVGARVLLLDEDTCATNFMIRDARMQRLVASEREPIVPFIDRVRELYERHGVSTILVMGGSGDYLDVADTVILMDHFRPYDVTAEARRIAAEHHTGRRAEGTSRGIGLAQRTIDPSSISSRRGSKPSKITVHGLDAIIFGVHEISFRQLSTAVDESQLRAIGEAIEYAKRSGLIDRLGTVGAVAREIEKLIAEQGLDVISPHRGRHPGDLAEFRRFEFAAALNRLPTLRIIPGGAEARAQGRVRRPGGAPVGR